MSGLREILQNLFSAIRALIDWIFAVVLTPEVVFVSALVGLFVSVGVVFLAHRIGKNENISTVWRTRFSLTLYVLGALSFLTNAWLLLR